MGKIDLKYLLVLKQDKKTGSRPVGAKFSAPTVSADVWIKLGLVSDVNAPKPKPKTKKKSK